jgi:hypothetical protein
VTALKWENEFKCEGIENLADFKAIIEDVNSVDPGPYAFRPTAPKHRMRLQGISHSMSGSSHKGWTQSWGS